MTSFVLYEQTKTEGGAKDTENGAAKYVFG